MSSPHPAAVFEELTPATPPAAPAAPPATEAAPAPPPAESTPQFTEQDAQAYRTMVDAGITPTSYRDFVQKAQALDNLSVLLKTNPVGLIHEIEKSDPTLAQGLLESLSDEWYARYQRQHPEEVNAAPANGTSRTVTSDPRIEALERKFDQLIEQRNQDATAKQQEKITEGYNKAMDGLVAKLPESTPERDKDYIRLKAQELIWKDVAARERVARGTYVDVAKYFAEATKLATAETKAAASKEIEKREAVVARGERSIPAAAETTGGTPASDNPHKDPIWDAPLSADQLAALKAAYR